MPFLYIFFLLIYTASLYAISDTNTSTSEERSYVDTTHDFISQKILSLSKTIDSSIYGFINTSENNTTKDISMDDFFKNEKYIDDTDDAFIQLRLNSYFPVYGANDYKYALKAHIPLSRTKNKLNLFIQNKVENDNEEINNINPTSSKTEVGINLFSTKMYNIKPKYSVGIRSFDPFVRARYSFEQKYNMWDIYISQIFKYSIDDKFSENTNLYFDTKPEEKNLFRVAFHRSTDSQSSGMNYGVGFHYYLSTEAKTAIRVSQTFTGNTNYTYTNLDTNTTKRYAGINSYTTSISLRKNVWKEWIFYQITPSASFYKYHEYKENYSLNFMLEFYFGRYDNK